MQILSVLNRCVYGLKRLLFFLELHQAFVLIYFALKQKIEKVSIFFKKKPWTNLFWKLQILSLFLIDVFIF